MDASQLYEFDVNGSPLLPAPLRHYPQACPRWPHPRAARRCQTDADGRPAPRPPGVIVIKNMLEPGLVDEMNSLLDADTAAQAPGCASTLISVIPPLHAVLPRRHRP